MSRYVTCETLAAIVIHIRELEDGEEPCYSGRKNRDAKTICGRDVGWDTKIKAEYATCIRCMEIHDRKIHGR